MLWGGEAHKNSDWGGPKGPGIYNDLGPLEEDLHLLALLSTLLQDCYHPNLNPFSQFTYFPHFFILRVQDGMSPSSPAPYNS